MKIGDFVALHTLNPSLIYEIVKISKDGEYFLLMKYEFINNDIWRHDFESSYIWKRKTNVVPLTKQQVWNFFKCGDIDA